MYPGGSRTLGRCRRSTRRSSRVMGMWVETHAWPEVPEWPKVHEGLELHDQCVGREWCCRVLFVWDIYEAALDSLGSCCIKYCTPAPARHIVICDCIYSCKFEAIIVLLQSLEVPFLVASNFSRVSNSMSMSLQALSQWRALVSAGRKRLRSAFECVTTTDFFTCARHNPSANPEPLRATSLRRSCLRPSF